MATFKRDAWNSGEEDEGLLYDEEIASQRSPQPSAEEAAANAADMQAKYRRENESNHRWAVKVMREAHPEMTAEEAEAAVQAEEAADRERRRAEGMDVDLYDALFGGE